MRYRSWLKRAVTRRQEGSEREIAEVGIAGKDALSLLLPVTIVSAVLELLFYSRNGLEEKLAVVAERNCVLAREAAGDLVEEDFSEGDVDGGRGLKVADGGEDVCSEEIPVRDAAHLATEVVMAERGVAGISGGGAAFPVGAKMSTATGRDD